MAKTDRAMAFFYDWGDAFELLSGDDCKALLRAMLKYSKDGTEPEEFHGIAKMAATLIFPILKRSRDGAAYARYGIEERRKQERTNVCEYEPSEESMRVPARVPFEEPAYSKQDKTKQDKTRQDNTRQDESRQDNTTLSCDAQGGFDAFWNAYPRHTGQREARDAYEEVCHDGDTASKIIEAVNRQKRTDEWRRDGGRFVPAPAKWLIGRRWNDETTTRHSHIGFDYDEMFDLALAKGEPDG